VDGVVRLPAVVPSSGTSCVSVRFESHGTRSSPAESTRQALAHLYLAGHTVIARPGPGGSAATLRSRARPRALGSAMPVPAVISKRREHLHKLTPAQGKVVRAARPVLQLQRSRSNAVWFVCAGGSARLTAARMLG
jgi:hypothetical protein